MKRSVLTLVFLQLLRFGCAESDDDLEFPEGFMLGVATASYQVEGGWNDSDKGEGTWDRLTHTKPWVTNGDNGDVASDSFHKYKEDVQLVKDLGMDFYRISLSWPRILPNGTPDKVSANGVQYYNNLINEILAKGIVPFVTLFHFDDVQLLYEKTGGWINESMIEYFADYSRVVFREFGDRVKFWSTFNEPEIFCTIQPFVQEQSAPAYTTRYQCAHNFIKAHARAYHIYDDEFRASQNGKVGIVINSEWFYPKTLNDTIASEIAFAFESGWILDPIFSKKGGYPDIMVQRIAENSKAEGLEKSRLPEFSPFWIKYIKGTADYYAFNYYQTHVALSVLPSADEPIGEWYDSGVKLELDPKWPLSKNGWGMIPEAVGKVLRKVKDVYGNLPVYILESGYQGPEDEYEDRERISFLYSYIREVFSAIRSGCNVKAFTIWSLMDNFEWTNGYSWRFGLYHVDFNDTERPRTPRLSAHWIKKVMAQRRLIPPEEI